MEGKLRTTGIISPRWQKTTFFLRLNMRPSDLLSGILFAADRQSVKKRRRKRRRRTVRAGQEAEMLHWAVRNVGMWLERTSRAADPLWNVCVCVCGDEAEHIIRPAARRPNNRPRTRTNRNTSHSEQKPQITKGGVLGRPGVRFQSSESGCRLAAELLEALLETNPFAWTVSKKKQCAVFRPLDKGGWTMLYKKKAMQLAL